MRKILILALLITACRSRDEVDRATALRVMPVASVPVDIVPEGNRTNWTYAGAGPLPVRTQRCGAVLVAANDGMTDQSKAIQAAIDACPVGQVVEFGTGLFRLDNYVQVKKAITLRGQGMERTTLMRVLEGQVPIIILGTSRWPKPNNAASTNLTADGVAGSMSVTVASVANLVVGRFVKLDQDDYTGASFQPMPPHLNPANDAQVLQSDLLFWPIWNPDKGNLPLPGGLEWHSRSGRPYAENKEIAAISGNTVTFTSPLHGTYTVAKTAQLTPFASDSQLSTGMGVENMTLSGGREGNIEINAAARAFVTGVECRNYTLPCFEMIQSTQITIAGNFIHDTRHPFPGGSGYSISLQHGTSEVLIENNIILDANKMMVMRSAGAGSVVAYNYADDGNIGNYPGWVEVGLNASHMIGSHHVLFEGNLSFNYDSDDRWGSSIQMTVFRNQFTGLRRSFPDDTNVRAIGLAYGQWNHAFIGNVLGSPGGMTGWVYEDPGDGTYNEGKTTWGPHKKAIYRLGYSTGPWDQYPDQRVRSTTLRDGNWDYVTNSVKWDRTAQILPASLYLTAAPSYFSGLTWPWVDATGATKLATLPAKVRFDAMNVAPPLNVTTYRSTQSSFAVRASGAAYTWPTALVAGRVLIVCAAYQDAAVTDLPVVSDTQANTYTPIDAVNDALQRAIACWTTKAKSGTNATTITKEGKSFDAVFLEYDGLESLDRHRTNRSLGSTNPSEAQANSDVMLATASSASMVFGFALQDKTAVQADRGFTLRGSGHGTYYVGSIDKRQPQVGTYAADFRVSTSQFLAIGATFKEIINSNNTGRPAPPVSVQVRP